MLGGILLMALAHTMAAAAEKAAAGFRVKHVYSGAVYLEAGSSDGLASGQRLTIRRHDPRGNGEEGAVVGEIELESVTPTSAAGEIVSSTLEIAPGDLAYLSGDSLRQLRQQASARETQRYSQTVGFTTGIPPERELRENMPKPPLPEVNRARGQIGMDFSGVQVSGSNNRSSQFGFILRLDMNRIGGSYWNLGGYQRVRIQSTSSAAQDQTLTDLINRTYHLSASYDNPGSRWVAGFGRLYVPWASSLSTLDGLYAGRRFGKQTVGFFGGTTPDPTSWDYDPHRQMAGLFVNTERGSFESFRFTSTSGVALSRIRWQPDRQFGFFENSLYYKHFVSIYSNVEADVLSASRNAGRQEVVLSRSYLTVRLQPHKAVSFDLNESYFRNIPTFDTRLIGTGLLDKYLFQGFSGGFRLALPYRLGFYANAGRSSRTNDRKPSWNYLSGASLSDIVRSGVRAEYRYSRFDSSFGRGTYQSFNIAREIGTGFRFELQAGKQELASAFTSQSRARFVTGSADWYIGLHYFMGFGATVYRGQTQNYSQYFISLGYRFDNRR